MRSSERLPAAWPRFQMIKTPPRNVNLLTEHAFSEMFLRRFSQARRKLDEILNITPDDIDTLQLKAGMTTFEPPVCMGYKGPFVFSYRIFCMHARLDAPEPGSIAEPFRVLAEMHQEGLIKHLGVSTVSAEQIAEAQSIAPVVCVQNFYNIANRQDDSLIDPLAEQGIAYVPYFPLGGFSPLQSETLSRAAARLGATPMAVALAWLLQCSPNILLIPGTSSVGHLRENVAGVDLQLPEDAIKELNNIAS